MIEFIYEALDNEQSVARGRIDAESVTAAVLELESRGLQVLSIKKADLTPSPAEPALDAPASIEPSLPEDRGLLYGRISEILEKRETLAPALEAFAAELPPGRMRRELGDLVARMQAGVSAEEFCSASDRSASWLLLLGRGAASQRLLCDLLDEAGRENEGDSQWNRALVYPASVFAGSLGVLVVLCIAVVPIFASIFDDFELELPTITFFVLEISDAILRRPFGVAFGALVLITALILLLRLLRRWGLPGQVGNLLTTGNSFQVTAMARFTRRLAEALDAGLRLPAALRLAGGNEERGYLHRIALRLADEAGEFEVVGQDFEFRDSNLAHTLPSTVVHALQAGSNYQPSIPLLRQLSEIYSRRVRDRQSWSSGYVANLAVLGVGFAVAFVVLALFMPLVSLINALT